MDPATVAKGIYVPTYHEILARVKSRYPHNVGVYERERRSLELVRNVIVDRTEPILRLRRLISSLHPFYREFVSISFDLAEIERDFACVEKARAVAETMWERYRYLLMSATKASEARRIGREGRGRMMSQLRRCAASLERLKELTKFISGLPGIDVDEPIVIVAGPPNAGKSTFVATVSTARPEVAPYPFTTKTITVGHADVDGTRLQVIDTPGILDRPFDEMNYVERRAAAAIRHLPGPVLFLFDPTPEAYMDLDSQLGLARRVIGLMGTRPFLAVVNKVDLVTADIVSSVASRVKKALGLESVRSMVATERGSALAVLREALRSSP